MSWGDDGSWESWRSGNGSNREAGLWDAWWRDPEQTWGDSQWRDQPSAASDYAHASQARGSAEVAEAISEFGPPTQPGAFLERRPGHAGYDDIWGGAEAKIEIEKSGEV